MTGSWNERFNDLVELFNAHVSANNGNVKLMIGRLNEQADLIKSQNVRIENLENQIKTLKESN